MLLWLQRRAVRIGETPVRGRRRRVFAAAAVVGTAATALAAAAVHRAVEAPAERRCHLDERTLGDFVDIPGGGFVQGAGAVYAEEGPPRRVFVSPFRVQAHEVTNSQFAAFVAATGYQTEAERNGGSALFRESTTPEISLSWWSIDRGATWRTPEGEGSSIEGRGLHPVVHVSLHDARAYAEWAGGRLPTEVEWEYAASLGLFDPMDPESGVRRPDGTLRANIWTGPFPVENSRLDGYAGTAPVGCFEPGLTGAYDMIGNVWEWTSSAQATAVPRFTIKGGSYLCSHDHCRRYRIAARQGLEADFSAAHVGFRIVQDLRP
jgi:formylglycine-generating enzyme required for sulfatase activity